MEATHCSPPLLYAGMQLVNFSGYHEKNLINWGSTPYLSFYVICRAPFPGGIVILVVHVQEFKV